MHIIRMHEVSGAGPQLSACSHYCAADVINVCTGGGTGRTVVHLGAGDGTFGAGIALDSLAGGTINNSGRRRMLSASTADPQVSV